MRYDMTVVRYDLATDTRDRCHARLVFTCSFIARFLWSAVAVVCDAVGIGPLGLRDGPGQPAGANTVQIIVDSGIQSPPYVDRERARKSKIPSKTMHELQFQQ